EGGVRATPRLGGIRAGLAREAFEGGGLVNVWAERERRGGPVQQFGGAGGGGFERHAGSHEWALEHAGAGVANERGERVLGERVGQGEGGGEVLSDAFLELLGGGQGQQCAHALSSVNSR